MPASVALLLVTALSGWGTYAFLRHAQRVSLLDIPTDRSSHTDPTPRGGGAAFALAWIIGVPAAGLGGLIEPRVAIALAGGGGLIAVVGWVDDHGHVHSGLRLATHFLAAGWTIWFLGGLPSAGFGPGSLDLGPAGSVVAALGMVWMVNLYNFMDGIDGLAGLEAVTAGLAIGGLLAMEGASGLGLLAFGVGAAAAGFLLWNWPPARIFMGDVGSGLLGYAFAALAVAGERVAGVPAVVLLLPLGVFIADATYTLARRLLRGERVYQAHRSHVYQRLVQAGWAAREVNGLLLPLNAVLGLAAWAAITWPGAMPIIAVAAATFLAAAGAWLLRVGPPPGAL